LPKPFVLSKVPFEIRFEVPFCPNLLFTPRPRSKYPFFLHLVPSSRPRSKHHLLHTLSAQMTRNADLDNSSCCSSFKQGMSP
jgi:hypothetical protein